MTEEILYPSAPDDSLISWILSGSSFDRFDAIDEGTLQPDQSDYVRKRLIGEQYFDDIYDSSGNLVETVLAYNERVRINLGEMNVTPESGGFELRVFGATFPTSYNTEPEWGIGTYEDTSDKLVAYWTLDEEQGIRFNSLPGGLYNWSADFGSQNVLNDDGIIDNGALFEPEKEHYLYIPGDAVDSLPFRLDSDKSFGGWFSHNITSGDAMIFLRGRGPEAGNGGAFTTFSLQILDGGILDFTVYTYSLISGRYVFYSKSVQTTAPDAGELSHVICVYKHNERKIMINLNNSGFVEQALDFFPNNIPGELYLGGYPHSYFDGIIDEWAFWDTALDSDYVSYLYNSGTGITYPLAEMDIVHATALRDANGLEIARLPVIDNSGSHTVIADALLQFDSTTPTLKIYNLDDVTNQQESWSMYDLSSVYLDMALFTEKQTIGIEYNSTSKKFPTESVGTSNGYGYWSYGSSIREAAGYASTGWSYLPENTEVFVPGLGATDYEFEVPEDATITGVEVEISAQYYTNEIPTVFKMQLTNTGGFFANEKNNIAKNSSTPVITKYGGNADLWGATLTPAIVNSTTFGCGVQLSADTTGYGTPYSGDIPDNIDLHYVKMKIYYSLPTEITTSLSAAIFTLDMKLDGTIPDNDSITLFTKAPEGTSEDTTLFIDGPTQITEPDTTLYINGPVSINDAATLFIDGVQPIPSDSSMSLHTIGGIYDNDLIDLFLSNTNVPEDTTLHITGNASDTDSATLNTLGGLYDSNATELFMSNTLTIDETSLFIQGQDNLSEDVQLNISGKLLDSDSTTMFVAGAFSSEASMNTFIKGFGGNVDNSTQLDIWGANNSGLRDITSLFMNASNSGDEYSDMNLAIHGPDMLDVTSNMPLSIRSDPDEITDSSTMFIKNTVEDSNEDATMFISAPGTTEGAVPSDANMPLFMARDADSMYDMCTMFIEVAEKEDKSTSMYITNVPNDSDSITFYIPPATVADSGDTNLYTNGF